MDYLKNTFISFLFRFLPYFFPSRKIRKSSNFGVSMLLCHKDIVMAIYCLQGLFFLLGRNLPIYVIDDGSLTPRDRTLLGRLFTVEFDSTRRALTKFRILFSHYPFFIRYVGDPEAHIKKMKLAAAFLSPFDKTICVEPDILFLKKQGEILAFLDKSTRNYYGLFRPDVYKRFVIRNYSTEFILRKVLFMNLHIDTVSPFNGGLMLLNKKNMGKNTLEKIERTLRFCYPIGYQYGFYFEETLLSVLFDKRNSSVLPYKKYVNIADSWEYEQLQELPTSNEIVSLHFTTVVRHQFVKKAVLFALRTNFFRSPSFVKNGSMRLGKHI